MKPTQFLIKIILLIVLEKKKVPLMPSSMSKKIFDFKNLGMYIFEPISSKVRCICIKSLIYFNLGRGWTRKDKGNSCLKVTSCVYSLWPTPDIFVTPSYNREFLIVHWPNSLQKIEMVSDIQKKSSSFKCEK